MPDKQPPLAPGQRWVPTKAGTRQKARTVRSMTPEGAITLQEGDDPGALIYWNVDSFRAWIARHEAVLQEGE